MAIPGKDPKICKATLFIFRNILKLGNLSWTQQVQSKGFKILELEKISGDYLSQSFQNMSHRILTIHGRESGFCKFDLNLI